MAIKKFQQILRLKKPYKTAIFQSRQVSFYRQHDTFGQSIDQMYRSQGKNIFRH